MDRENTQEVSAEIVEATVIPAAAIDAQKPQGGALETVKIGRKHFLSVFLPATAEEKAKGITSKVAQLSEQEEAVLRFFLKTKSHEETAIAVGIKKDSVRRILTRPNLKRFLTELRDKAAIATNTDLDTVIKELRLIYEGEKKPDATQMDALKTLGKILTPKGAGVIVNQQQNNIYNGDNEALNNEWQSARQAAGGI